MALFNHGDTVVCDGTEYWFDGYSNEDPSGAYIYPVYGDIIGRYVDPKELTPKERGNQ
jgi:hypothetical protein